MSEIWSALQFGFIQKALLVGVLIGLSCSMLGIFMVLKKYSMIGDGLAHVSFATVAIALLLNRSPLLVSIPIVILASFLVMKLSERGDLDGDAVIALISSSAVAVGVLISSMANGFNVDLFSYLFGSILVISNADIWISSVLAGCIIITVLLFYNNLFAITYDENFANVMGINTKGMKNLILILTSVTIVIGIRVVGTMLISSLIIFPTVTALCLSRSFKGTIVISASISVFCVVVGVLFSYVFDTPAGATIVLCNLFLFILAKLGRRLIR